MSDLSGLSGAEGGYRQQNDFQGGNGLAPEDGIWIKVHGLEQRGGEFLS